MSIRVQRGERGAGKLLVDSNLFLKVLKLTDGRERVFTTGMNLYNFFIYLYIGFYFIL